MATTEAGTSDDGDAWFFVDASKNGVVMGIDPNVVWIVSGCGLLGLSCGLLGAFAYVRKQSLLGDVLAHATFPGVCLAFMWTGTKSFFPFLLGALLCGMIAVAGYYGMTRWLQVRDDAALAVTLASFFAIGIVLLTRIQQSGDGDQAGLDHFIFGQASAMVAADGWRLAIVAVIVIVAVWFFYHPLQASAFDVEWARLRAIPVKMMEILLFFLYVVVIVAGIQAVGVLMMAALLITPAVTARHWTHRLRYMLIVSGIIGAGCGGVGAWIGTLQSAWPTGPIVVLAATTCCLVTMWIGAIRRRGNPSKGGHR